jgi:hypothetical protein
MHTNYRLFVLTESDALILIVSAGQQLRERAVRLYRSASRMRGNEQLRQTPGVVERQVH